MSSSGIRPEGGPRSFLVVCFRFIGDVMVTLPLAVSIRQAIPEAVIDYLVFEGTEGVLAHNPLVSKIIAVPSTGSNALTLFSLFRKYDVAFAAYPSDRTAVAAAMAGKRSIGLTYKRKNEWWKETVLDNALLCDDNYHVVANILGLLKPLKINPNPRIAMGCDDSDISLARTALPEGKFVVLHPYSRNRCKYWPAEYWGRLAGLLHEQTDCKAVFTVTPDSGDAVYLQEILAFAPQGVITFKEPCTLTQLAAVIKRSEAYVGIDTVVTHIAASLDVPTVALFGPSMTRYWGPWPNGCQERSPFSAHGGNQRIDSVTVIQKDWGCVPCNRETCAISTRNKMECLEAITPIEVLREVIDNVCRN
jgi:heptosyltransferase-3